MNDLPDLPQSPGTVATPIPKKIVRVTSANTVRGVVTASQHAYKFRLVISMATGTQRQALKDHYNTYGESDQFDALNKNDNHTYRLIWDNELTESRVGPDNWDMQGLATGTRIS